MKILFIGDIHGKLLNPLKRLSNYNDDLFDKLEWLKNYANDNSVDVVVHLGDIADKPEISEAWKNKFIQIWRQYNGKFYSIVGKAHDLFNGVEESFSKTCLYNLELSGVLTVLKKPVEVGDVVLYPLSMHTKEAKKQIVSIDKNFKKDFHYILLAHQFYEWALDTSAGFTKDELSSIQSKCELILGHDHRQHETEQIGEVQVFRPGSLMRTELSEVTITQKPRVLLYDNGVYSYIDVPYKPIEQIYDVQSYRVHKSTAKAFRNIQNNLNDLSKYLTGDTRVITCSEALKQLNCPKEEYEYLRAVHQLAGQEF